MILSVSRRTDIPAFFHEWFFRRLAAGYVLVRNPMNVHQVSKVILTPEIVDGIVFWTKNPEPMLLKTADLEPYLHYWQITITPYGTVLEPAVPASRMVIRSFMVLSECIGPDRVIWRYDPILFTSECDMEYHCREFTNMAKQLAGYTKQCVISFLDLYQKVIHNMKNIKMYRLTDRELLFFSQRLVEIGRTYGIRVSCCSDTIDFSVAGMTKAQCIDQKLLSRLLGEELSIDKDKNQRPECGCAASIDIGSYHTCRHGCRYCYANVNDKLVHKNLRLYDEYSPLLIGQLQETDTVTERKVISYRTRQLDLFR